MASASDIKARIDVILRDWEVANVPGSGGHEPAKPDLRPLLKDMVDLGVSAGTTLVFSTVDELEAASTGGLVVGNRAEVRADPAGDVEGGNGVYSWSGTAWVWISDLLPATAASQADMTAVESDVSVNAAALGGQGFKELPSLGLRAGRPVGLVKFDKAQYAYNEVALPGVPAYAAKANAVDLDPQICYIYVQLGQSNAEGVEPAAEGAIIASTPVYPSQALMSELGARINTREYAGAFPAPRSRRFDGMTDLVEFADTAVECYETSTSSTVNHLIKMVADAGGPPLRVFGMTVAHGSYTIFDLKRGSDVYAWFLMSLSDAVSAIRASGWRPVMLPISWCQGESDAGVTNKSFYCAALLQLVSDLNEDVKRIVDTKADIKLMVDAPQMASAPVENDIVEAEVLAARRDSRIILGAPYYQHPRTSGQIIHMSAVGQNHKGVDNARTLYDAVFGGGHVPLEPVDAWFEPGNASITIRWPRIVTIDTSGTYVTTTSLPNYKGLYFDDRSVTPPTITGHSFAGGGSSSDFLTLTLSGASSGPRPRLSNAFMPNSGGAQGPVTGMRSLIRSTRYYTNIYDSVNIYEWSRPFVLSL